jgi:hypothetical protein
MEGTGPRHLNPFFRLALLSQNREVRRLIQWVFLEGLATGEAFLEAVPEEDLGLAQAPAQEDLLSISPGQEVYQPVVQIFVQE